MWTSGSQGGVLLLAALLLSPLPVFAGSGPVVTQGAAATVPRRALPDDGVCVPLDSAQRVAAENARAPLLWVPGPYGPKTCANGYVWRVATPYDLICVTPTVRDQVEQENSNPQLAPGQ
jgi:hypothetical protein